MNPNLRIKSLRLPFGCLLALGALLAGGATVARGQVVFTFTTTANAGAATYGYGVGNVYTFIFSANTAEPELSTFGNSQNKWLEETLENPQLVTSIGGTGLLGSYVRPTGIDDAPYSNVTDSPSNLLGLLVRNDAGGILGIQTLNGTDIGVIQPNATVAGVTFDFPNTTTFLSYWENYVGTYPSSSGTLTLSNAGGSPLASFSITQVSIAAAPEPTTIPEPAAMAVILGGVALLGGLLLRRGARLKGQPGVL